MEHKNLAAGRWFELTLMEQMGNIGSEVNRTWAWQKKNHAEYNRQALERALELFELTLSDPRWIKMNGRLKEIGRARELFCDLFFGQNQYNETGEKLMKYFDEFALAARKDK
ncbi:MAG: hypothetical protein AAB725_00385 [Patescibacteria group bacterium]